jgi:hypothetical protein
LRGRVVDSGAGRGIGSGIMSGTRWPWRTIGARQKIIGRLEHRMSARHDFQMKTENVPFLLFLLPTRPFPLLDFPLFFFSFFSLVFFPSRTG